MPGMSRPHLAQVPTLTEFIDVPQAAAQAQPTRPMNREPAVMAAAPVMRPPVPLDDLPVLGEVVAPPAEQQALPLSQALPSSPPEAPLPAVTEAQLTHRVLSDVQRQIDGMLEFRLKEAMAPLLARHTEAIVRDLRDELNQTLRDVVARSVAQELAKLRQR